jgi:prephenate dehydrogenase
LKDVVTDPDVVLVAVPTKFTSEVIIDALRHFPESTVIDVASIKSQVVNEVEASGLDIANFVPSHPMSGKEKSGATHAAFDLFQDRIWVLSPTAQTSTKALMTAETLVKDAGAIPVVLGADEHDSTVAMTSHVPQVVSSLLAANLLSLNDDAVKVSGQGLRDMTRLAASNAELWTEILSSNAQYVSPILKKLSQQFLQMSEAVEKHDVQRIAALIRTGNEGRKKVPGKHGAPAVAYATVSILIDDKPGQLAAIFECAGSGNFNIEDVDIDHSLGKAQAIIHLHVEPSVAAPLTSLLRDSGWIIRTRVDAD